MPLHILFSKALNGKGVLGGDVNQQSALLCLCLDHGGSSQAVLSEAFMDTNCIPGAHLLSAGTIEIVTASALKLVSRWNDRMVSCRWRPGQAVNCCKECKAGQCSPREGVSRG